MPQFMTVTNVNINTPWCRFITSELVDLGIRHAVVCPGSRSAAMVSAMRECGQIALYVQTDERSAAFFALGLARSVGRPVAVCVTSGSAVANLVPALTEAYALSVPLVMLTCDRPRHLRGMGLPQTTKQAELCLPVVQHCLDLPDPNDDVTIQAAARRDLNALIAYLKPGPQFGPIQINIPLAGRLSSVDGFHGWVQEFPLSDGAKARCDRVTGRHGENDIDAIIHNLALSPELKGLIVGGPDDAPLSPDLVRLLGNITEYPLIADAPGSLRSQGIEGTIAEADFLLSRSDFMVKKPDLVIRLGSVPVSSSMQEYLKQASCKVIRIDAKRVDADYLATDCQQLIAPDRQQIVRLAEQLAPGNRQWRNTWVDASASARIKLKETVPRLPWSEIQAIHLAVNRAGFGFVHLANSLALRLANLLLPCNNSRQTVYANRGVSGIDGTVGSFLGEAAGHGTPGLLAIGDLAMLHDIPALEACLHQRYQGVILILNNDGAGLFDMLPVRTLPDYKELVRNPHGTNFEHIARAFGLGYARCRDLDALQSAMDAAFEHDGIYVVEATFRGGTASKELFRLLDKMARPG